MAGIIRISEMVSLALHSMVYIADSGKSIVSTKEMAGAIDCSESHLVKVLQRLVQSGFLYSVRGPKGGFGLVKKPEEVTLLEIYQSLEGNLILDKCFCHLEACPFKTCIFGGVPEKMNQEFISYLREKRISDFLRD